MEKKLIKSIVLFCLGVILGIVALYFGLFNWAGLVAYLVVWSISSDMLGHFIRYYQK